MTQTMNLPERFQEFGEARQQGFLRVKKLKEEGGKVAGIFCTFTPLEILDAAGFTAVSLCGMSEETTRDAEVDLPKNMCPLIKSSYGFAVSEKCPYTYFSDLIVGETTCDGKKKMYELLDEIRPTYVLHLPQSQDRGALETWTEEIRRFAQFLEKRFGVKITDEAIRQAAQVRNEERQARLDLMDLQKTHPPLVSGYQLYKTLEGSGFMFDPAERIKKMRDLQAELQAQGPDPTFQKAKRILVTGCPIGGVLEKTVKTLEAHGGVVVCFENCSGIKAAYQMVDTKAPDIYAALAERYLQIGCSVMSPNPCRLEHLSQLVEEFGVDGIMEVDLQACTPYLVESKKIHRLAQSLNIPYLALETDYSQSDTGQLGTRIEAFLEMI